MALWEFLGPARERLHYWNRANKTPTKNNTLRKLSPMNELFLTLIRLRLGLTLQDIAYRFHINQSLASSIVITWVQFMYVQFIDIKSQILPTRSQLKPFIPKSFRRQKNIRCIIDCTDFLSKSHQILENRETNTHHTKVTLQLKC